MTDAHESMQIHTGSLLSFFLSFIWCTHIRMLRNAIQQCESIDIHNNYGEHSPEVSTVRSFVYFRDITVLVLVQYYIPSNQKYSKRNGTPHVECLRLNCRYNLVFGGAFGASWQSESICISCCIWPPFPSSTSTAWSPNLSSAHKKIL